MWKEIKTSQSLMVAEMWKEFFEGEGIPTRIMPASDQPRDTELATYRILVPGDKEHIAEEALRKL